MTTALKIEPGRLQLEELRRVWQGAATVALAGDAWAAIDASSQAVQRIVAKGDAAYGINTGFPPEQCLVFEDAPNGVEAAQRAGMKAVLITTSHSIAEIQNPSSVLRVIRNFNGLHVGEFIPGKNGQVRM